MSESLEYHNGAMRPRRSNVIHLSEYRQPRGVISRLPTQHERAELERSTLDTVCKLITAAGAMLLLYVWRVS